MFIYVRRMSIHLPHHRQGMRTSCDLRSCAAATGMRCHWVGTSRPTRDQPAVFLVIVHRVLHMRAGNALIQRRAKWKRKLCQEIAAACPHASSAVARARSLPMMRKWLRNRSAPACRCRGRDRGQRDGGAAASLRVQGQGGGTPQYRDRQTAGEDARAVRTVLLCPHLLVANR